jgi:Zn-dependent membrane protease YugP
MFGFHMDPVYFMYVGPAMVLAMLASFYTKTTFAKYSKVRSLRGLTGAEAAQRLLGARGLNVSIELTQGMLTDHYDPSSKTLRLSPDVYNSSSLSAIGVACHEAGHAIQDAEHYPALGMRTALVPLTQFGSTGSYIMFLLGMLLQMPALAQLGVVLFGVVVLFSIVTLPVEWDASARAKLLMVRAGIVDQQEADMAGRVLNAAFLTYVASAFTAIMELLYYMMWAGLLGGRRND